MRHTNAGQTILNILTSLIHYSYGMLSLKLWTVVSSPTIEAFKTSLRRCRIPQIYNSDNVRGDIVITL